MAVVVTRQPCQGGALAPLLLLFVLPCSIDASKLSSMGYGTPERFLSTTDTAKHVIKAAPNEVIKYNGLLSSGAILALVDETSNSGTPCVGAIAGGAATTTATASTTITITSRTSAKAPFNRGGRQATSSTI